MACRLAACCAKQRLMQARVSLPFLAPQRRFAASQQGARNGRLSGLSADAALT